jgi:hypothetical protein
MVNNGILLGITCGGLQRRMEKIVRVVYVSGAR